MKKREWLFLILDLCGSVCLFGVLLIVLIIQLPWIVEHTENQYTPLVYMILALCGLVWLAVQLINNPGSKKPPEK